MEEEVAYSSRTILFVSFKRQIRSDNMTVYVIRYLGIYDLSIFFVVSKLLVTIAYKKKKMSPFHVMVKREWCEGFFYNKGIWNNYNSMGIKKDELDFVFFDVFIQNDWLCCNAKIDRTKAIEQRSFKIGKKSFTNFV